MWDICKADTLHGSEHAEIDIHREIYALVGDS